MSLGCPASICKSRIWGLNSESAVFLLYILTLTATNCTSLASACNWPQALRIQPPTKAWLRRRPTPTASNIDTRYPQQAGPCLILLRVYRMSSGPVLALTVLEVNASGWVEHRFLTQVCKDLKKESKKFLLCCRVVTFNTERRWKGKRKANQILTMWGNRFENGRNGGGEQ